MTDELKSPTEFLDGLQNSPEVSEGVELIQQWQYIGKVHPELLDDKAFEYCKKAGLTSVQSYVYWAEIEKEQGIIDFSDYDVLVEKLTEHKLKWVPFLILGPYYATPQWFQKTDENLYAKCLEHGRETMIQSIWNPYLPNYVDSFLRLVGEHYQNCDVIESIELGISGNWGEALYPAWGGFLQSKVGFHTHSGWWCGDECAINSFRKFATERYESLSELNAAWGTKFRDFGEVSFPSLKQLFQSRPFAYHYLVRMPNWLKSFLGIAWRTLSSIRRKGKSLVTVTRPSMPKAQEVVEYQWCLDFIEWYLGSMNDWAEFWLKTARKYFPHTEIYLVTGGNGDVRLGADFSAQVKVAAKYNAGIRITNQNDDYAQSFIRTRLVSAASRFYQTYFTTEEAGINKPFGVTMRLFDAATSGAKGAYFKSIIGTGKDVCTKQTVSIGKPTQGAVNLAQNIHHLTLSEPIIEVAVLFPNTSIALNSAVLSSIYNLSSRLRDVLDFDLVDENMIADDALEKYRFLFLLDGNLLHTKTLRKIEAWVKAGGVFIVPKNIGLFTVGEDTEILQQLFPQSDGIRKVGGGYTVLYPRSGQDYLEFIRQSVYNREKKYPWTGIPEVDDEWDGVYATRFANKIMFYNSTNAVIRKTININDSSEKLKLDLNIEPYSITSVDI